MSGIFASIRNVSVRYGDTVALRDVSLDIAAGQRLAIIGESGSGKSTLALAMAGLLPGNARLSGEIAWPGLGHPPVSGRDIGFVFQDPGSSLNPVLTVGEQVAEVAQRHLGQGWRDAYRTAESLLDRVRLPEPARLLGAYPHQLSGGQRQRVAIAAAIAARPKLLVADEPTSALDVVVQADILALLDRLVAEDRMTMVLVTHDIALASSIAERIAVFHEGRLVEQGGTAGLLSAPREAYTARLLASHIDLTTPPLIAARPA